jgi:hypothetical protein
MIQVANSGNTTTRRTLSMTSRRLVSSVLGFAILFALAIPTAAFAKDERTRVSLINTGEDGNASGKAEFRIKKADRMRFKVEAEDLDPANYDVTVGGVVQGVLNVVVLADGRVEGEIEFDTKREPGKEPLDFDPRGQLITIERASVVYLQVVFPGTGTPGGGGGSCN